MLDSSMMKKTAANLRAKERNMDLHTACLVNCCQGKYGGVLFRPQYSIYQHALALDMIQVFDNGSCFQSCWAKHSSLHVCSHSLFRTVFLTKLLISKTTHFHIYIYNSEHVTPLCCRYEMFYLAAVTSPVVNLDSSSSHFTIIKKTSANHVHDGRNLLSVLLRQTQFLACSLPLSLG